MEFSEVKERIKKVGGWLSPAEASILYRLGRGCSGKGAIVEIGSWQGKSTICLAGASQAAGGKSRVIAIDPHIGSPEHQKTGEIWTFDKFKQNIRDAGLEKLVTPIVKMSGDAAADIREPVELLFIDGAHEYEAVKQDFEQYFPKLIDGGYIAFHDTIGWPGPEKLVAEAVFTSNRFRGARFANSITYAQKVPANTAMDRLWNRLFLVIKNIYAAVYITLLKIKIKLAGRNTGEA
ncbi:MAG TPA: class I SAM-dependent methyltransferase [Verrucomicrobiae bacterium]|nr:class I SAM-dependent methyltransferase [Verrucomicrobiae bacterium]